MFFFFLIIIILNIDFIHVWRLNEHERNTELWYLSCASGLRRICFDASVFGWFSLFSPPSPVLVTWLLPVAGATYKHVVIKVFDLLWFPVEVHTFPDWQTLCCCHCDQWVTMKREPQSDRAEIEHGVGSGMAEWEGDRKMHQLRFGMLIWKHIYSFLPVHSLYF